MAVWYQICTLTLLITNIHCYIPSRKPVSYQVHSWNDLSLWSNGFKQQMTHIKIDAHFMANQTFCIHQKQVTSDTTNGCFLLSHDLPISSRQYNSTDDVLKSIQNNLNIFNSSTSIFMAICFKLDASNPCDNSTISNKWLTVTTTFINSFTSLINKYNLNLQLILDGTASSDNECLAHLWMPYIKTFTGNPSNPIANSNNQTLGYDRFSVLDTSVKDSTTECTNSFNNWVKVGFEKYNTTQQPWLWWEPSSQQCINELTQTYNSSHFEHNTGFYFAINIDIQRFKIYSKYNSWNEPMKLSEYSTNNTQVIASFIDGNGNIIIVTFVSVITGKKILYSISSASGTVANDLNISKWIELSDSNLNGMTITSITTLPGIDNNSKYFAISTQNGILSLLSMDTMTFTVKMESYSELKASYCNNGVDISSVYVSYIDKSTTLMATQLFICNDESIFGIQHWIKNESDYPFTQYADPILITDIDIKNINDVSIIVINNTQNIAVWSTKNKEIYGTLILEHMKDAIMIGIGNKPRLSMSDNRIIMVNENGYCWISEKHLKQSEPATCNALPISKRGVLSYTMGSIDNWINKLMLSDTKSIVSVCDKYLIHGMYDGGYNPYPNIFIDSNGKMGVVAVHNGIDSVDKASLDACGAPIVHNDLMIDSWEAYV